jgi:acetyltransferase
MRRAAAARSVVRRARPTRVLRAVPATFTADRVPPPRRLPDDARVQLVPLAAAHADAMARYLDALSDRSRAYRFLAAAPAARPAWARQLCGTDGVRHLGFVAVRGGALVGECQLACDPHGPPASAEFALSVADALQGRGIGRALLGALADAAERRGLGTLTFEADAGNARMLGWMARCGARWSGRSGLVRGSLRASAVRERRCRPPALGGLSFASRAPW